MESKKKEKRGIKHLNRVESIWALDNYYCTTVCKSKTYLKDTHPLSPSDLEALGEVYHKCTEFA